MTGKMPYDEWLEEAQKLPEGRSIRTAHVCGNGKAMLLEHTTEGYRAYCHRCHQTGWKPHGRQSLNKQLERLRKADNELTNEINNQTVLGLPNDFTQDIPAKGLLWLSAGGITRALVDKYNLGYSPYYGRVFIPVYMHGRLVFWQARAVEPEQKPKYINPKLDKSCIRFVTKSPRFSQTCVVTEDVLSAIRVGEIKGYTGVALLGTTASAGDLNYLTKFKNVALWLDPDQAGRKAKSSISRSLRLLGVQSKAVNSDRDPKLYDRRTLEAMLNEQLRCNNSPDPQE